VHGPAAARAGGASSHPANPPLLLPPQAHNQLANYQDSAVGQHGKLVTQIEALKADLAAKEKEAAAKDETIARRDATIGEKDAKISELEGKVKEALSIIHTEREVAERLHERLDNENQELVEKLSNETKRAERIASQLQEEKEDLKDDLEKEREHHDIKVSNSNKIYEENAVLEKQLRLRMDKIESLTELNSALATKVASLSQQAASTQQADAFSHENQQPASSMRSGSGGLTPQERAMLHKLTNRPEDSMQARVQQGGNAGGNAGFMAEVNGNMPAMERGGNAANWAQQLGARFGL